MLVNETDLKRWLPVNVGFTFANLYGDLVQAERKYLKPILGTDLYDALNDAYTAEPSTLTEEQTKLLDYVQPSLVNLTLWMYTDKGNVEVSDSGIHINVTETRKAAFEWQVKRLRDSYLKRGADGLDDLLLFLEENEADYADWTDSDAQVEAREIFVQSAKNFQKYVNINSSRMTYTALLPIMRRIQEDRVRAVIGDDLYDELAGQVTDGAVSVDNEKLMRYIRPAMAHLSYAEGLDELAVIVDGHGVNLLNNTFARSMDGKAPAETQRIRVLQDKNTRIGEGFLKKLEEFLIEHYEDYPLYGYDPETTEGSEYKPTDEDAVVFLG